MARTLRPAEPVESTPSPPPELAERLAVADWLDGAERVALPGGDALVVARRRWRGARRAWLAAHDVPRDRECEVIPHRHPSL